MSKEKTGFIIITYKLRLYSRHQDWLLLTKQMYHQVVWHYYQILIQETVLLEQSTFLLLRKLEELSIGTKEMRARGEDPPWELEKKWKVPLYFRRAAINTAIGLARNAAVRTEPIDCSPVFYKGIYREFSEDSIEMKLFNGEKWKWVKYSYTGRSIPKEGWKLSPTLKVEKDVAYLHVPVKLEVKDIRTVEERMKEEELLCAVAFPDSEVLAVCVILDREGKLKKVRFLHGGKRREAQRKRVLRRLEKSRKSRQGSGVYQGKESVEEGMENRRLFQKLVQINQYYAHKISREILTFCQEEQVRLIVVPNYKETIPLWEYRLNRIDFYRWQGRAMIRKLKYKSFREGILVTTVPPVHLSDCCSECSGKIRRYQEGKKASKMKYGGSLFVCPNGHRGNTALNTAKNIGRYFLRRFQKKEEVRMTDVSETE